MTDIQTIIYQQPIETLVQAENKLTAKGDIQPEIKVSISRKLEDKTNIYLIISSDINEVVEKVKIALEILKNGT